MDSCRRCFSPELLDLPTSLSKTTYVKLTLEIEAEASDGFAENEVSVIRDNTKQLKFRPEATGFED